MNYIQNLASLPSQNNLRKIIMPREINDKNLFQINADLTPKRNIANKFVKQDSLILVSICLKNIIIGEQNPIPKRSIRKYISPTTIEGQMKIVIKESNESKVLKTENDLSKIILEEDSNDGIGLEDCKFIAKINGKVYSIKQITKFAFCLKLNNEMVVDLRLDFNE